MSGIYIHIPFCRHACSYCNFYFSTKKDQIAAFTDALVGQIGSLADKQDQLNVGPIQTIYFGGGTPSLLSVDQVSRIHTTIQHTFDLSQLKEWSFELNPENADLHYLRELKDLGVDRLSMGVQSFQPHILRHMHRSHTKYEAIRALENIAVANFKSFNTDLIYAYPNESITELEEDLEMFVQMGSPHISAYALTIEQNTRLGNLVDVGKLKEVEEEVQSQHFDIVQSYLSAHGLNQYEVSNFSKAGHESVHNSNYWTHQNYLGFGPSAHSFLWSTTKKSAKRWKTAEDLAAYIHINGNTEAIDEVTLNLKALAEERIMLGLRTRKGLLTSEMAKEYNYEWSSAQLDLLNQWQASGVIEPEFIQKNRVRLTASYLPIADHLIYKLITA